MFRNLIILFVTFTLYSCVNNTPKEHLHKKFSGIYIDHGRREGLFYMDKKGLKYNYRNITTTITNDTIIPIQIKIALSKEYNYPAPFNNQKFKVFLLPETMTAEKQYKNNLLNNYLDAEVENAYNINKTIYPKKEYSITIGVLTNIDYVDPGQLSLMTKKLKPRFFVHDSLINIAISNSNPFDLFLGLDFTKEYTNPKNCYSVIPCGQISFVK